MSKYWKLFLDDHFQRNKLFPEKDARVMAFGSQLSTRRGTREGRDIGIGKELGNFISKEELIVFSDLLKLILEVNILFEE